LDAGAFDDPLIGRVDADRREIAIHEHGRGHAAPCARDVSQRSLHGCIPSPDTSFNRRPMCSSIRVSIACTPTLIAFLMARGEDLPCEMMLMPLTPRSGAPPCSE